MRKSVLSSRGLAACQHVGTGSTAQALSSRLETIVLSVAENVLMEDVLAPKLREIGGACFADGMRYAPSWLGLPELRASVASTYNAHVLRRARVVADDVAVTASATAAIDVLLFALAEKGDVVLTPAPYYGSYRRDVEARAECVMVGVSCRVAGAPSWAELEAACAAAPRAPRVLLLCSPHNPTGALLDAAALRDAVRWAASRGVHLVVDEVFALSVFGDGPRFVSALDVADELDARERGSVHVVWGAAKDLAFSGLRVGCAISKDADVVAALKVLGVFCSASVPAQLALHRLLADETWLSEAWLPLLRARLRASWRATSCELARHSLAPPETEPLAGHFCLLDLRTRGVDDADIEQLLAREAKVLLTPGPLMGAEHGTFRLCHSAQPREKVAEAIQRIASVLAAHSSAPGLKPIEFKHPSVHF